MTQTLSPSAPAHHRTAGHSSGASTRRRQARELHRRGPDRVQHELGLLRELSRYTDRQDRTREVLARPAAAGSVLVIDRDLLTHGDVRLVAHLAHDEPAENAAVVCRDYLADIATNHRRCRALTADDLRSSPFADERNSRPDREPSGHPGRLVDRHGYRYRLELLHTGMSIPELRWWRQPACGDGTPVSVREIIAAIESYEPVCPLTSRALSRHGAGSEISTTVLRAELARVQRSPIVLNRRLREVVLEMADREQLSISEIAIRCGRVKRDRKGNESGETSWLARRLGLLPEGGRSTPTPWIHSDVLALIARSGLGISPREVEL